MGAGLTYLYAHPACCALLILHEGLPPGQPNLVRAVDALELQLTIAECEDEAMREKCRKQLAEEEPWLRVTAASVLDAISSE